jgi:hypothetical protein
MRFGQDPMTADERKKRGEQSAVIVERLVRLQLRAMGCERAWRISQSQPRRDSKIVTANPRSARSHYGTTGSDSRCT